MATSMSQASIIGYRCSEEMGVETGWDKHKQQLLSKESDMTKMSFEIGNIVMLPSCPTKLKPFATVFSIKHKLVLKMTAL